MKQFVIFAALTFGVAQFASAAPVCVSGSLASFIALDGGGCMIGTNTLSGFQALPGIAGATAISPNNITITPIGGTTNPGITVMPNPILTATNGQIFDALITYMLSGNLFTSDSISLSNATSSGFGGVTDIQNFCAGGTFGPNGISGCTSGNAGSLLVLGVSTNQTNLAPVGRLSITHNFTIDSGGNGSASGATITDQFGATAAAIPEPATYLLAGLGLALAAFGKLRSAKLSSSRR